MATEIIRIYETPHTLNYNLTEGSILRHHWTLQSSTSDDGSSAAAVSLANATLTFIVSSAPGGTAQLTLGEVSDYTGNSGVIIDSAANGQFTLWLKAADVTTLAGATQPSGGWYYEVTSAWTSGDSAMPNVTLTLQKGFIRVAQKAS